MGFFHRLQCNKIAVNNFSLVEVNAIWNKLNDDTRFFKIQQKSPDRYRYSDLLFSYKILSYNSYSNYSFEKGSFIYKQGISIHSGASKSVQNLCIKDILDQMYFKKGVYISYLPGSPIEGKNIAIYGVNENEINRIITLENKEGRKIFPRYYYINTLNYTADKFFLKWFDEDIAGSSSYTNLNAVSYKNDKEKVVQKIQFLNLIENATEMFNIFQNHGEVIVTESNVEEGFTSKANEDWCYNFLTELSKENQILCNITDIAKKINTKEGN